MAIKFFFKSEENGYLSNFYELPITATVPTQLSHQGEVLEEEEGYPAINFEFKTAENLFQALKVKLLPQNSRREERRFRNSELNRKSEELIKQISLAVPEDAATLVKKSRAC